MDRSNALLDGRPLSKGENDCIDDEVSDQNRNSGHELQAPWHPAGINHPPNIVLNEATGIAGLASTETQCLLDWGQGAGPAHQIDQRGPQYGRHVEPGPIEVVSNERSAKYGKCCEQEMNQQHGIGGGPIVHEVRKSAV